MARRKKHPEHANHERWLVSYADFITLLFAFFVTMYSISQVDGKKLSDLAAALSAALGSVGPPKTMIDPRMPSPFQPVGAPGKQQTGGSKRADRQLAELEQSLRELAKSFGGDDRFNVRVEPRGVVLSLSDVALFDPGDIALRRAALPMLDAVAHKLLLNPHPIVVEGHTDDRTNKPSANWRLSTDRAVTVLSYLVELHGYPPTKLAASGYGPYHPLTSNDTAEGRARNRRVDLVILRENNVPPDYQ